MKQYYPIHALHLRDSTENLLRHHQIFHNFNQYLYNDYKYNDGVLKFGESTSKVLDKCPTFIQANFSKTPPGHGITRVATQLYQGLLVDFDFSGMNFDDSGLKNIYEGIYGETCQVFIIYYFTIMKHGYAIISK